MRKTASGAPQRSREPEAPSCGAGVRRHLRRLDLERIDLHQLHRIDPVVPFADQLGTFKRLQEEGRFAHCCCHVDRMSWVTRRISVFTSGPYASLGSFAAKSSWPATKAT